MINHWPYNVNWLLVEGIMYCLRQTYRAKNDLRAKIVIASQWLETNIGPIISQGLWYSYGRTSEFMPLSDRLRASYELPGDIELNEIKELAGDGWCCYNTFEYVLADGDYVDHHYGLYIVFPDETIALQCKLAVL
jgi:hypothetical protein